MKKLPQPEVLCYKNIPLPAYTIGSISERERLIVLRLLDIQLSIKLLLHREANNKISALLEDIAE